MSRQGEQNEELAGPVVQLMKIRPLFSFQDINDVLVFRVDIWVSRKTQGLPGSNRGPSRETTQSGESSHKV